MMITGWLYKLCNDSQRFFFEVLLLLLFTASPLMGGGWTLPRNGGYAKLWLRWQAAIGALSGHYGPDGTRLPSGDYNEIFFNTYGEYGLAERLTLVGFWPVVTSFHMSNLNDYSYTGTGDMSLGLRWGIIQHRAVLALQFTATAPLANSSIAKPFYNIETGERIGELRVGAGVWDLEPRLQAGYGWNRGHAGAEIAYKYRSKDFLPVLSVSAEGGRRLSEKMYGTFRTVMVEPLGTSAAPLDNSPSGIGNGTEYVGFAFEVDWQRSANFSLGLTLEGAFTFSRQTGGPVMSVYSAWKW